MKIILLLVSWLWVGFCAAESSSGFDLQGTPLRQVVQIYFSELYKSPYVICDDLLKDERVVSVRASGKALDGPALDAVLQASGYDRWIDGGVTVVCKQGLKPQSPSQWVYRPRFRSASYLVSSLQGLVGGSGSVRALAVSSPGVSSAGPSQSPPVASSSSVAGSSDVFLWQGPASELKVLKALVEELDREQPQVLVKALIYEVGNTADVQTTLSMVGRLLGGRISFDAGVSATGATARVSIGGLEAVASLLDQDSRFRAVSRPQLVVSSGSEGVLVVGQSVPTLGAVVASVQGQTSQSIVYRDSGVQLRVSPEVLGRAVRLNVSQEISDFVRTGTGVNGSPTLNKRQFNSVFSLVSGQVGMIAGLQSDKRATTAQKFFGFALDDGKTDSDSQLLLFLQVEPFPSG